MVKWKYHRYTICFKSDVIELLRYLLNLWQVKYQHIKNDWNGYFIFNFDI